MSREALLLLFPAFTALCLPLGTKASRLFGRLATLASSLAGLAYGLMLFPGTMLRSRPLALAGWRLPFGSGLFLSPFSLAAVLLIYGLSALVLGMDWKDARLASGRGALLLCLLQVAALGLVLSADLFGLSLYLALAITSSTALASAGGGPSAYRRLFRALVLGQLCWLLMLAGIALTYGACGRLSLASLARFTPLSPGYAFLAAFLILLPVLLLGRIFPFSLSAAGPWQEGDPREAAFLCATLGVAGATLLARMLLTLMGEESAFGSALERIHLLVLTLGAATVVAGAAAAFRAKSLAKVLDGSAVVQMGMLAVGIGAANAAALRGALILLVSYSAARVLLFLAVDRLKGPRARGWWRELRGAARRHPSAGALFLAGALTLMGVPLFPGFWGKIELLRGIFSSPLPKVAALPGGCAVLAGAGLEAIVMMRVLARLYERTGAERGSQRPAGGISLAGIILAAALAVAVLLPSLLDPWLSSAVHELLDPAGDYVDAVLRMGGGI